MNSKRREFVFLVTVILFVLCFSLYALPARSQSETVKAADLLQLAIKLRSDEGPTKALPEFERALVLFQKEGDRKNEAITIGLIGNCYKALGQHPKALEYLERALAMKRQLGDRLEEGKTLNHIGLVYWESSNYPKAIEHFNLAAGVANELGNKALEAAIHNNIGLVYDETGDSRALGEYNRAYDIYRGSEPSTGLADTIGNIGGWHLLHGEYAEGLKYYEQALEVDEKLKSKPKTAVDLENIGLALTGLGRYEEALKALDRGISLAHDAGIKKEEADCRRAKASALLTLGRYNDALEQYNLAVQVYQQTGPDSEPEFKQQYVEALGDIGNLHLILGDAASAERDFRRAIDVAVQINHPRGVTINLISLGDLQLRQKRFVEAIALYNQALSRATAANDQATTAGAKIKLSHTYRNLKRFDEAAQQAQQALAVAKSTQGKPLEAEALYALAETQRANDRATDALNTFSEGSSIVQQTANPELGWRLDFGRGQTLESLNRNDEALAALQNAVKTIETVRNQLREERYRAGYIEDKYQVYVTLVQLLLKLGRNEEAFVTAEKLRARSYLDMLNRGQQPIRSTVQRERETTLKNRIRELQKKVENEASKPPPEQRHLLMDQFSNELTATETEYANFLDDLTSSEPAYAAAKNLKVPSVNEIRANLSANTALVGYVIADEAIVIFVATNQSLRAKTVPVRIDDLTSRVETLRDLMRRNKTNEWKLPAASLYKTLVGPVVDEGWLKGIDHLYIIPHAILHYVPFAVLLKSDRFLIDDYVISYLPAAVALTKERAVSENNSILAMAPANTRLQYTRLESESVSEFFPKQHKLLVGPSATESSFKQLAGNFDLIHLATHGYFNKTNPMLSALVLEPGANDDGRLEVHEIMTMRLKARLVTLSACDTAVGSGYFSDVPPGDDLVGLTRAFLSTGTPSVLASLWEINDRSAVSFMDDFYSELRRTDKATALALTQRQMRARGIYRHPYYWAAFVLVGEMQ